MYETILDEDFSPPENTSWEEQFEERTGTSAESLGLTTMVDAREWLRARDLYPRRGDKAYDEPYEWMTWYLDDHGFLPEWTASAPRLWKDISQQIMIERCT